MQAPVGRSDTARPPAGRARGQAHQPGLRRAGARRRGRERAREGASVAGPAPGTRRQTQGPGLLVALALAALALAALALAACAKLGDPPGGPPDTTPPTGVAAGAAPGEVGPDFHGRGAVQDAEGIHRTADGAGAGPGGAPGPRPR